MSVIVEDYEERNTKIKSAVVRCAKHSASVHSNRRVLIAYPGQAVYFNINIKGPINHTIAIVPEDLPKHVASTTSTPDRGVAPFISRVTIKVNAGAPHGLYPFSIVIHDLTSNMLLGREKLALLVLRPGIPTTFAKKYRKLIDIYARRGAMWLIWYLLKEVFINGATFRQLKTAYELIRGEEISNGTIGNILKRMIRKRIIYRDSVGLYHLLVDDPLVVDSRIDEKRVHVNTSKSTTRNQGSNREPYTAKLAFQRALKIKRKHGVLPALYFLTHTVIGARMTGHLLYWYNDWFIVCEDKTGFLPPFLQPIHFSDASKTRR